MLKELEHTEGRGTGIPKILRAMRENGSPPPIFEFDEDHLYFAVTLPVHPQAAGPDQETPQVTAQVQRLLSALGDEPASTAELMRHLGLAHRQTFLYAYLRPALEAGLVEMTRPDAPRSSKQRYRLTAAGRSRR